MEKYLGKVTSHLTQFQTYEINQISRPENLNTDALAKLASAYETDLARLVPVEILDILSILEPDMMEIDSKPPSWMDLARAPSDPKQAKRMA